MTITENNVSIDCEYFVLPIIKNINNILQLSIHKVENNDGDKITVIMFVESDIFEKNNYINTVECIGSIVDIDINAMIDAKDEENIETMANIISNMKCDYRLRFNTSADTSIITKQQYVINNNSLYAGDVIRNVANGEYIYLTELNEPSYNHHLINYNKETKIASFDEYSNIVLSQTIYIFASFPLFIQGEIEDNVPYVMNIENINNKTITGQSTTINDVPVNYIEYNITSNTIIKLKPIDESSRPDCINITF